MTWRPADDRAAQPRPVGDSLDRVTRGFGGPSSATLASLFRRWPDVVGAPIAAHARPLSLADGVLVIAVDDPGWGVQLTYLESQLLDKVEAVLGDGAVARIQVKVRPR